MSVLPDNTFSYALPCDDVNQTLGQIFDNDRWLWQPNNGTETPQSPPDSTRSTPENDSARSAVFKGLLDRLFLFFKSLTHGTDASNHTRAKVLATSLFLSLDSHHSRAASAARRCTEAFRGLCVDSSSPYRRRLFLQTHQAFTKILLDRNHHFISSKASQLALVQYESVMSRQGTDGFLMLQESSSYQEHLQLPSNPAARLHLLSFYAQILQLVVQTAFVMTTQCI